MPLQILLPRNFPPEALLESRAAGSMIKTIGTMRYELIY